MKLFFKIFGWLVMSIVLLCAGLLICTATLLKPGHLTPIAQRAANRVLNADVELGRVAIELRSTYPFLNLEVDSLVIISRDIKAMPLVQRDTLPAWIDTLATVANFKGGINLLKAIEGKFYVNDVIINEPRLNIFIANEHLNNFNIVKSSADATESTAIPDLRIKSFEITNPGLMRYLDASTGMRADARLVQMQLADSLSEPDELPKYKIDINANVASPLLSLIGDNQLQIGCNGVVDWQYNEPYSLRLTDFTLAVDSLCGNFSTSLDFADELKIESLSAEIEPIDIDYMLKKVPTELAKEWGVPTRVRTNARIGIAAELQRPYVVGTDVMPYATISIDVPECYLLWRKVDLRRLLLRAKIDVAGMDFNAATVDIEKFVVAGPATTITANGLISNVIEDPRFKGNINGRVVLDRLPPVITRMIGDLNVKGTVKLNTRIDARQSMLSRANFHKLKINGTVDVDDFYYLAPDTLTMVYATHAHGEFGTNNKVTTERKSRRTDSIITRTVDSLLTAKIVVDSTMILAGGLDMRVSRLQMGVGARNTDSKSDTTAVIPMGGKIQVGAFSLFTLSDSAGFRIRDLNGTLSMQRYHGDSHLPVFTLNAELGRLSAGDNSARFMVSKAQLRARINKLAETPGSRMRKQVQALADSLQCQHPDLPPDSVYVMALEIRRRRNADKPHRHRVHEEVVNDDEVIDWGVSNGLKRLLLDWNLRGTLTAERARLFTSAFPLRNRMRNLEIRFNNDSILLNNIAYKAGKSDFNMTGAITNIKRGLTSRRHRQPLKLAFDLASDTIDVNQLANAFFVGAAQRDTKIEGDFDNESQLEEKLELDTAQQVGPLLIPVNIDAEISLKARNVLYSDFILHDLQGSVLAYDGALSLHNLRAASDVGAVNISALYAAPRVQDMRFGFGMQLKGFKVGNFLKLVPAIDSIMPMMRNFDGTINANMAATSQVDQEMNLLLPTLDAVVKLDGDSLVVLDEETYKTMAKWLMFKDKKHGNVIPHMSVELIVENNVMQIFPFMFDFDRYRLGVQGHNDLEMNFDYHVAVLKSPLPFKFGINIKGNADDYKIRVGKARFNENKSVEMVALADTTRVNLINQFENVFRRGVQQSGLPSLKIGTRPQEAAKIDLSADTLSSADSLVLRREGLVP